MLATTKIVNVRIRTEMCQQANGARPGVKCVAVLVTDGEANRERNETIPEANLAKNANIDIYTIGVTTRVDVAQLTIIASEPKLTHYYYVNDYRNISNITSNIATNICRSVSQQ